jgi:hypothetical protein
MRSKVAIAIAVNYTDETSGDTACLRDVDLLSRRLLKTYGVDRVHKLVQTTDDERLSYDESTKEYSGAPTKKNIKTVFNSLNDDDEVFFYYSGHAGTGKNIAKAPHALTSDGAKITFHTISNWIENSPAKNFTLMIDCCYAQSIVDFPYYTQADSNGNVTIHTNTNASSTHEVSKKNVIAVYACAADELEYEDTRGGELTSSFEELASTNANVVISDLIVSSKNGVHRGVSSTHTFSPSDNFMKMFGGETITTDDRSGTVNPLANGQRLGDSAASYVSKPFPVIKKNIRKYSRQTRGEKGCSGGSGFVQSAEVCGDVLILALLHVCIRHGLGNVKPENISTDLKCAQNVESFVAKHAPDHTNKPELANDLSETFAKSYFAKYEDILVNDADRLKEDAEREERAAKAAADREEQAKIMNKPAPVLAPTTYAFNGVPGVAASAPAASTTGEEGVDVDEKIKELHAKHQAALKKIGTSADADAKAVIERKVPDFAKDDAQAIATPMINKIVGETKKAFDQDEEDVKKILLEEKKISEVGQAQKRPRAVPSEPSEKSESAVTGSATTSGVSSKGTSVLRPLTSDGSAAGFQTKQEQEIYEARRKKYLGESAVAVN